MRRVPVASRVLRSVGYRDSTLEVEFNTGEIYRYFDVPARVHGDLMDAESHGRFFNAYVRDRFRFARL